MTYDQKGSAKPCRCRHTKTMHRQRKLAGKVATYGPCTRCPCASYEGAVDAA